MQQFFVWEWLWERLLLRKAAKIVRPIRFSHVVRPVTRSSSHSLFNRCAHATIRGGPRPSKKTTEEGYDFVEECVIVVDAVFDTRAFDLTQLAREIAGNQKHVGIDIRRDSDAVGHMSSPFHERSCRPPK